MKTDFFLLKKEDCPVFEGLYPGNPSELADNGIVFGAVADGEAAALAAMELLPGGTTFWLSWFYVKSEDRRQRLGSALMYTLIRGLKRNAAVRRLQAPCLTKEQTAFFHACGFTIRELPHYHFYEGKLSGLAELKSIKKKVSGEPISSLTPEELEKIQTELDHTPGVMPYRIRPEVCLPESCCLRTKDGLQALLLLQEEEDTLIVSYAYAKNGNGAALFALLQDARESVESHMDKGKKIRIATVNNKAANLVERLLPEAEKQPVFLAEVNLLMV